MGTVMLTGCGKKGTENVSEDTARPKANTANNQTVVNYNMNTDSKELTDQDKNNIMDSYEFAKTEGYIDNATIRSYMGDDTIASFANLATTYVDIIYDVNAITIENDRESYDSLMNKIVSDTCIVGEDGDTFATQWAQAVVDSGAVINANFSTGKEYVYADDTEIYVRGILELTVESAKDISKLNGLMPVDIEIGRNYKFVYDVGFLTSTEDDVNNGKIDYILALATY